MSYPYDSYGQDNKLTQARRYVAQLEAEELRKQQYLSQPQVNVQVQQPNQVPYSTTQIQEPETNVDWIIVSNDEDIDKIKVEKGQTKWFMSINRAYFGGKSLDNFGIPEIEKYAISPYIEKTEKVAETNTLSQIDLSEYVRLADAQATFKSFETEIINLRAEIDNLKSAKQTIKTNTRKEVTNNG